MDVYFKLLFEFNLARIDYMVLVAQL